MNVLYQPCFNFKNSITISKFQKDMDLKTDSPSQNKKGRNKYITSRHVQTELTKEVAFLKLSQQQSMHNQEVTNMV